MRLTCPISLLCIKFFPRLKYGLFHYYHHFNRMYYVQRENYHSYHFLLVLFYNMLEQHHTYWIENSLN